MRPRRLVVCTVIAALSATSGHASSPRAWAELFAKANVACINASNLKGATARGAPIDFEAAVLVIVDGRHAAPHMKDSKATLYCLHHKQTGKTEVAEAAAAVAPNLPRARTSVGRTCWSDSFRAQLKTAQPLGVACSAKNDEGDTYQGVVRR